MKHAKDPMKNGIIVLNRKEVEQISNIPASRRAKRNISVRIFFVKAALLKRRTCHPFPFF